MSKQTNEINEYWHTNGNKNISGLIWSQLIIFKTLLSNYGMVIIIRKVKLNSKGSFIAGTQ